MSHWVTVGRSTSPRLSTTTLLTYDEGNLEFVSYIWMCATIVHAHTHVWEVSCAESKHALPHLKWANLRCKGLKGPKQSSSSCMSYDWTILNVRDLWGRCDGHQHLHNTGYRTTETGIDALPKEAVLLGDWNSWRTKAAVNKQVQVTNWVNNLLCVFIWALDLWLLGRHAGEKLQFKWRQMEAALLLSAIIIISVTSDAQAETHTLFKAAQELNYKLTAECLIHNWTV